MRLPDGVVLAVVIALCLVSLLKLSSEDAFDEAQRTRVEVCE